jgi:hypothetical protein
MQINGSEQTKAYSDARAHPMFAVYKPNNDESKGAAMQFRYDPTQSAVFISGR